MTGDRLYRVDVAELLGIQIDSLQRARLPQPDGREPVGKHVRPWWYRSTIEAWLPMRPRGGARWSRQRVD